MKAAENMTLNKAWFTVAGGIVRANNTFIKQFMQEKDTTKITSAHNENAASKN